MDLTLKVRQLRAQGVVIPSPQMIEIGEDVALERVIGPDTVLHPGTRLHGSRLAISPGCQIGAEGPAVVQDCALGRSVTLKGGYFAGSVFLEGASCGLGAHVRAGTLLEEQASAAHTVGLKQTILLPFVTLGSLINFCDILMAGGTSRRDHSEVGSSFIHFNYTPYGREGDKATPSLIGDVPRGVMLRSPRIFLGGQAGLVGPTTVDYGTVLAAGYVYRRDHGPDVLVIGEKITPATRPFRPRQYGRIRAKLRKNLRFIGNLSALWQWYEWVRMPLTKGDAQLALVYRSAQRAIADNVAERIKQLARFAGYMDESVAALEAAPGVAADLVAEQRALSTEWPRIEAGLRSCCSAEVAPEGPPDELQRALEAASSPDYLSKIAELPSAAVDSGTRWLEGIVQRAETLGGLAAGRC